MLAKLVKIARILPLASMACATEPPRELPPPPRAGCSDLSYAEWVYRDADGRPRPLERRQFSWLP